MLQSRGSPEIVHLRPCNFKLRSVTRVKDRNTHLDTNNWSWLFCRYYFQLVALILINKREVRINMTWSFVIRTVLYRIISCIRWMAFKQYKTFCDMPKRIWNAMKRDSTWTDSAKIRSPKRLRSSCSNLKTNINCHKLSSFPKTAQRYKLWPVENSSTIGRYTLPHWHPMSYNNHPTM